MKKLIFLFALFGAIALANEPTETQEPAQAQETLVVQEEVYQDLQEDLNKASQNKSSYVGEILESNKEIRVSVIGQGVAPSQTISPSQAYALAKRAAIGDAYRLIAEKVNGVYVEGQDVIRNMMIKRTDVRTYVHALVKEASIVETTFKEGLCEVEMEIVLYHSLFVD